MTVRETNLARAGESSKRASEMEQHPQSVCLPWNLEYDVLNAYVEGLTTPLRIRVTAFVRLADPEYRLNVACDQVLAVAEPAVRLCAKQKGAVEICQNVRPVSGAQDAILTVTWGWRGRFGVHWFEGAARVGKVFEEDSVPETVVRHVINMIEELRASGKAVFDGPTLAPRKVKSGGIPSGWQTIHDELERRARAEKEAADVVSICSAMCRRGRAVWAPVEMHECDAPDDIEGTIFVGGEEGEEYRYHVLHKPQLSFGRKSIEERSTEVSARDGADAKKRPNDVVVRSYQLDTAGNPILPKPSWTEEEKRDFKKKMEDANGMVSRKHFELKEEDGNLVLRDRSKFGTTVNGAKVARDAPVALREGEKAEVVCGESLRLEVEVKGRHDEPGLCWDCLAWDHVGYRCVQIRQPEHSARQDYIIVGTQLLIGSGNGCDIRLRGDGVSEVHCRIFRAYGELWLESLAGGFSTTAGEEELPAHVPMHLDGPVKVGVGDHTVWFGPYCPIVVGYDYVSGWMGVAKWAKPSPPLGRKEAIEEKRTVHCAVCGKELATEYAVGGVCKQAGCSNVLCRKHWREKMPFCPEHAEKREARIRELREKGIELLTEEEVAASRVAIFSEIDASMADAAAIHDPLQNKDIPIGKVDWDRKHVPPIGGAGEFPEAVIYTFSRRRSLTRRKLSAFARVGVCFCFDQEHMKEHEYITGPAGLPKLNSVLKWLQEQAHACRAPSVFCLFSPTGWEKGLETYVEREFQDCWLHLCLRGRKEEFIVHRDDPAADAFLPILCQPRFRQQVVSKIKAFIDGRLETSHGVAVSETVRKLDVPRRHVETAFRVLAKEQPYDLSELAGHGLVISRRPTEGG